MVGLLNKPTPNTEGNHQGKASGGVGQDPHTQALATRMLEPEASTFYGSLGAEGDQSMSVLNALTLLP